MGSVIKSGNLTAGTKGPGQTFPFDDMGSSYLGKVKDEAARIIAQARAEAEKIKAQAIENGKRESAAAMQAAVQAKVEEQMKTLRPALDDVLQKLTQARHAWQRHWEEHALKVSLAMAGKIVRGELANRPEITLQWIREALELAAGSEQVTLRLHPHDLKSLAGNVDDLIARLSKGTKCQIVGDANISAGGCLVETEFGVIDQQLESQLARLDEELLAR